jgi:Xaa-Pro aminopeptidase
VGIDIHESPRFSQACNAIAQVGHVMTVEPGIYLPGVGGVRIENTVIVREGGCDVLTMPTRELIIL